MYTYVCMYVCMYVRMLHTGFFRGKGKKFSLPLDHVTVRGGSRVEEGAHRAACDC